MNIFIQKGVPMDLTLYRSELPYVDVVVDKNLGDSKVLMPSYAGASGEMTAIMTYTYQHFVADKELATILEGISLVEMHHFDMLGKAITKLGGYPVVGGRTYWNGSFVNYTLDPKRFLKQNIIAEETAILNYERTILNLSQDCLKMMIERIILDEEIHIKLFKDCLSAL